jgi:hypothetical protein
MASPLDMLVAISAQVRDRPNVANPLAAIAQIIRRERNTSRARILAAILHGIATEKGAFSESDILDLDLEALGLVVLLTQDVVNGRHSKLDLLLRAGHAPQA